MRGVDIMRKYDRGEQNISIEANRLSGVRVKIRERIRIDNH